MEQDRPGRDRCPGAEQEEVGRGAAGRAGERLVQGANVSALSAERRLLIRGEHRASSRSALSAVRR